MEEQTPKQECVYKAIMEMIKKMKEDVAKKQSIAYIEQIEIAKIYYIVADTLAEACKLAHGKKLDHCEAKEGKAEVSYDTFILLNQLKEDGLISENYANLIFDSLAKMKPELKETVEKDRGKGLL
jgi:hypothetical protein